MAFACDICSKKHQSGHNVSHANNKTKRTFNPNLQRVRAVVDGSVFAPVAFVAARSQKPSNRLPITAPTITPVPIDQSA